MNDLLVKSYPEPDAEPTPKDDGLSWYWQVVNGEPELEPGMDKRPWLYRVADNIFCYSFRPWGDVVPSGLMEGLAPEVATRAGDMGGWTPPGGSWVRFDSGFSFPFSNNLWHRLRFIPENVSFRMRRSDWIVGPDYDEVFGPPSARTPARAP